MAEETQEKEENFQRQLEAWVEYPSKKVEELRKKAVEKGADPREIILGYVINTITGDDPNSFLTVIFVGFDKDLSREAQQRTNSRIEWELSLAETPDEIKEQLRLTKERLASFDWDTKEGFDGAYKFWKENVQDRVLKYRDEHPEVLQAFKNFLRLEGLAVDE